MHDTIPVFSRGLNSLGIERVCVVDQVIYITQLLHSLVVYLIAELFVRHITSEFNHVVMLPGTLVFWKRSDGYFTSFIE